MSYELLRKDNVIAMYELYKDKMHFDVIYADCIYDNSDITWLMWAVKLLAKDGIIFIQTDYHTVAEMKIYLDRYSFTFINWLIYIQEWGGTSKRFFPRKHDDILMYANSENYKFYPNRIQIPKATAGTKLDKKGTGLKTPCDVFYDLGNFSTISKERLKDSEGKNLQWQKPMKLMERLLLPTTDEGDWVLDPFMGSGTTGEWCIKNNRSFVGIEYDQKIYDIAKQRLSSVWEQNIRAG